MRVAVFGSRKLIAGAVVILAGTWIVLGVLGEGSDAEPPANMDGGGQRAAIECTDGAESRCEARLQSIGLLDNFLDTAVCIGDSSTTLTYKGGLDMRASSIGVSQADAEASGKRADECVIEYLQPTIDQLRVLVTQELDHESINEELADCARQEGDNSTCSEDVELRVNAQIEEFLRESADSH